MDMDSESFDALVAKALAGELSAPERVVLDRLLGEDLERRNQFDELSSFLKLLRETAPYLRGPRAPERPIPLAVLNRLRRAVSRRSLVSDFALQWIHRQVSAYSRSPDLREHFSARLRELEEILCNPLNSLLQTQLSARVGFRGAETLRIYAPLGNTLRTTPLILWRNEPGRRYDVILREATGHGRVLKASGVVSPLPFSALVRTGSDPLQQGVHYKIAICEAGRASTASEVTFYTTKQTLPVTTGKASQPASETPAGRLGSAVQGQLASALQALGESPPRYSDALADLLTLPSECLQDEAVLRLKLAAFAGLGFQHEHETVLRELRG